MLKSHKGRNTNWGKRSKLFPNKTALNELNRSNLTLMDYSKQVPTNPNDPIAGSPLLVNLMRKPN